MLNCGCWLQSLEICFPHLFGIELHVCAAVCVMNRLLFSLAEVPWSWTKIKFWDVSVWIKIWKEEIERWVWYGDTIVMGAKECKYSACASPWAPVWEHVWPRAGEDALSFLFLHFILPCRSAMDWVPVNGGISATGPATEFMCCRDTTALGKLGFGVFFIQEFFVGGGGWAMHSAKVWRSLWMMKCTDASQILCSVLSLSQERLWGAGVYPGKGKAGEGSTAQVL